MSSWGLLDEREENELHKLRLLNVEEKPFRRLTKHLHALNLLATSRVRQGPTPPPESNGTNGSSTEESQSTTSAIDATGNIEQLKESVTLDFAAFISNLERLQLLLTANAQQRDRYVKEKARIEQRAQEVRDRNGQLRIQLEQARETLEQRKKFDELADKITRNPTLRPSRAEQTASIAKLEEEIAQLQAESETYAVTWRDRRDQFSRIMDESMRLRRQIRDEKEEVERREGMDDEDTAAEAGGAGAEGSQTPSRGGMASGNATPRPENGLNPKGAQESSDTAGTPHPVSTLGGRDPARDSPAPGGDAQSLKPRPSNLGGLSPGFSRAGSQAPSRAGSQEPSRLGSQAPSRGGSRSPSRAISREASPVRVEPMEDGENNSNPRREGEDVEMVDTKAKESAGEREVKEDEDVEEPDSPLTPLPEDSQDTPRITVENEDEGGDKMDTT